MERYRQHHAFPGEEQTATQEVVGWILDLDDKLADAFEAVGETALRGLVAVKRRMRPEEVAGD